MSSELVNIIVPIYKVEKYLNTCLESIVNQTYTNLEIVLVDDGSPDHSPQICDAWALKDSRIKIIHQENKAVAGARNTGLQNITGNYFMFVDPDDTIECYMIELMVNALNNTDADLCFCGFNVIEEESGKIIERKYVAQTSQSVGRDEAVDMILRGLNSMLWNKMYRKSLMSNKIYFDESFGIGEDLD